MTIVKSQVGRIGRKLCKALICEIATEAALSSRVAD
jgi:hypothetical protein